jgi:hypothetical protein
MGQQQTMTVAAAEEKGGATLLRRVLLVLAVAALIAAMMAISAGPAMAKILRPPGEVGIPVASGNKTIVTHCNNELITGSHAATVANDNGVKGDGDCEPIFD